MRQFNKIAGSFQKTLVKLDALIQANEKKVETNMELIKGLREDNLNLTAEKQAAHNFKAGLQRLIGSDA